MGQDAWLELLPGLLLAVGIIAVFKGGSGWYLLRIKTFRCPCFWKQGI